MSKKHENNCCDLATLPDLSDGCKSIGHQLVSVTIISVEFIMELFGCNDKQARMATFFYNKKRRTILFALNGLYKEVKIDKLPVALKEVKS